MYAPDLNGFGESPRLESAYSLDDYVKSVYDFISECGLDSYDLLAHSFGGRIAIRLACIDKRLNKLILTGSAGLKPKRKPSYYFKVYCYKLLKKIFPKKQLLNFGSSEYKSLDGIMRQSYVKIVNTHQDSELDCVKNKTLIVFGKNDKSTPLYMAKKLNQKIKNSKLIVIEGAGHFAFAEKPWLFNVYIKEFLLGD